MENMDPISKAHLLGLAIMTGLSLLCMAYYYLFEKKKSNKEKCVKCGTTTANTWHGTVKKTLFCKKTIWKCDDCAKKEFIFMVNSNPLLRSKYLNIYKKGPEEVLSEFEIGKN